MIVGDPSGIRPADADPPGTVIPIIYEGVIREPDNNVPGTIAGSSTVAVPLPDNVDPFDDVRSRAVFCDLTGETNQFVAETQGTFTFNYTSDAPRYTKVNYTLDVLYNSGYFTDTNQDPDVAQEEYIQLNGRIELAHADDLWSIAITGQNLTDKKIVSSAGQMPIATGLANQRAYFGFVQAPRTIGVNFRYSLF